VVGVRLFLEMEDEMAPEELERGIPPRMLRIEVSSVEEARRRAEELKGLFANPRAYVHYCYHDEDPRKPCRRERIL